MWNLYFEEFEDLQPYHFNCVRRRFEVLEVVAQSLDYCIIFIRTLFVSLSDSCHDKGVFLLIRTSIEAHLGCNV